MQGNVELTALTHVVAAKSSNPLYSMLPLIAIVVIFYFLLIRPQRRRQQQQLQMQSRLVPGQRVMTTAGMIATIVAVEDDAIVLEIAPGVEARFVKQAVGQVLDDSSDEEETEESDETDETDEAAHDDIEPKTEPQTVAGESESDQAPRKNGEKQAGKKPPA